MEKLRKAYLVFDRYYMHLLFTMLVFFVVGFFVQWNYIMKKDVYRVIDKADKIEIARINKDIRRYRYFLNTELNYEHINFRENGSYKNEKDSSYYIDKIMENVVKRRKILARGENVSWAKTFYQKIGLIK